MKKGNCLLLSLYLLIIVFTMCACNKIDEAPVPQENNSESSMIQNSETKSVETPVSEEDNNGYFTDKVTEVKNSFGEITEEQHHLIADAHSKDSNGNDKGITHCEYYPSQNFGPYFAFTLPNPHQSVIAYQCYYRIGQEDFQMKDPEFKYNGINPKRAPEDYERVYQALMDGGDILFSLRITFSDYYIFTIHGEGFSDLVAAFESNG